MACLYMEGNSRKFLKEANQLKREVDEEMLRILDKYKVTVPQGTPMTSMVTLWDASSIFTRLPQIGGGNIDNTLKRIH